MNEPPLGTDDINQVELLTSEFVPPATMRLEFSRQIPKRIVAKRIFIKANWDQLIKLTSSIEGYHIWLITPLQGSHLGGAHAQFLSSQIANHVLDYVGSKRIVLEKEALQAKLYTEHAIAVIENQLWLQQKHPSGKTNHEIQKLEYGWYEIGGYFIWRGQITEFRHPKDGFQSYPVQDHEPWNRDIRFFLKEGYNLKDALRIQDELFMENFRTMLAAFAFTLASAPSPGPRIKIPAPRRALARVRAPRTPRSRGVDRAVKVVDSSVKAAARAYEAFLEVKEALEHATARKLDRAVSKQVLVDVQLFTKQLEKLANERSNHRSAGLE